MNLSEDQFNKIFKLLSTVKTEHKFYKEATNQEQGKIIDAFERTLFKNAFQMGISEAFLVLFLIYGDEFLLYEFKTADLREIITKHL